MYEWDAPKAERQLAELSLRSDLLDELWAPDQAAPDDLLRPESVAEVLAQAGHLAPRYGARSVEELAVILEELGDLTTHEVLIRCNPGLADAEGARQGAPLPLRVLEAQGQVVALPVATPHGGEVRWIASGLAAEYAGLRPGRSSSDVSGPAVLRRYLRHCGPVTRDQILDRYAFDEQWLDQALEGLIASRELVRGIFTAPLHDRTAAQPHQYCDRHLLEQMRRRTLAVLRREVQPAPLAAYAAFLIGWQGAGPAARPFETEALREIMTVLQGVALPGPVWEREVLPARLRDYAAGELGALCESGDLVWVAAGRDPHRVQVRFIVRGEGALFLPTSVDETPVSETARGVYGFLTNEGASFASDIQAGLGLSARAVQVALAELALAGWVTNDTPVALSIVLDARDELDDARRPLSTLESDLVERRPRRPVSRVISRERVHAAQRQVARRLHAQAPAGPRAGRWFPVHRTSILGPARSEEARAGAQARVLLARYGVLSRETVERENGVLDWSSLANQLARMELRGEVRRGYFVTGLSGLQYALPAAVELLRAVVNARADPAVLVVLNATDSANLYGGEAPQGLPREPDVWPRFHRLPSTHLVTANGTPVLIAEDGGMRMTAPGEIEPGVVERAVEIYLRRPGAARRVTVESWNGEDALGGPAEAILRPLGFVRTPTSLEWRR
jgi:ATP-dependent Lhr-like helicase